MKGNNIDIGVALKDSGWNDKQHKSFATHA